MNNISSLEDNTKDQEEKENWVMEQVKNEINEVKKREEADKLVRSNTVTTKPSPQQQPARQKKRYTRANSEKLFNDLENDIDDLLNDDDGMFLIHYSFYKSNFNNIN